MHGIADKVGELFNLSAQADGVLGGQLPGIDDELLSSNYSDEVVVNQLVKPLQWRLKEIKKYLGEIKEQTIKSTGQQIGVVLGINAIVSGFKKVYEVYGNIDEHKYASISGKMKTFGTKLKLTGRGVLGGIKKLNLAKINYFKNFRTNFRASLSKRFSTFKTKIKNPKGTMKAYAKGTTKMATFFNAIGVTASAVMIWIMDKQWKEVDQVLIIRPFITDLLQFNLNIQRLTRGWYPVVVGGVGGLCDGLTDYYAGMAGKKLTRKLVHFDICAHALSF